MSLTLYLTEGTTTDSRASWNCSIAVGSVKIDMMLLPLLTSTTQMGKLLVLDTSRLVFFFEVAAALLLPRGSRSAAAAAFLLWGTLRLRRSLKLLVVLLHKPSL